MWRLFRDAHGTRIPPLDHRGLGRFTSSMMTTVSLTFLCRKFTLRADTVADLTLHLSTGQSRSPSALGKDIRYVCRYYDGGGRYPTDLLLTRPRQRHVVSIGGPPATPSAGLCHSQENDPVVTDRPGKLVPTLPSADSKPPSTASPPCVRDGRASQLSPQRLSGAPPYQKTRRGCRTLHATRPGLLMQPGFHCSDPD